MEILSQDFFAAVESHAIISYTDLSGTIVYASDLFCQISKYSREELVGQNHRILKSNKHSKEFYSNIWKTISSGKAWTGLICNKAKDSTTYWVNSVIFPIKKGDEILGYGAIRTLVEENESVEGYLFQVERFNQHLYDNLEAGVVIQDEESKIIEMNEACPRILGLTKDQMLGKTSFDPYWSIIEEDGSPCTPENQPSMQAIRSKKSVFNRVIGVTLPDKSIRWIKVNSTYYVDKVKSKPHTITSFTDVTKIKNQDFLLTQKSHLSAIGETAASMAHEIKNPLSIINLGLKNIEKYLESSDFNLGVLKSRVEKVASAGQRMIRIVDSLQLSSRVSSNDPMVVCSIDHIVSDILPLMENKFESHRVKFEYDQVDSRMEVLCRPHQLGQVLLNLINNSVDALAEIDDKWIRVTTRDQGDSVEILVIDSGLGITEEDSKMLFEALYTTKAIGEGTGLGLSIAKRLVEENNGSIKLLKDEPNTSFSIILPKP